MTTIHFLPKSSPLLIRLTGHWLLPGLIALLPVLMTLGLLRVYLQVNVADSVPTYSDEVSYWHQIATFRAVGFQGGYYTVDEAPARAAFTRFGAHGPVFVGLVGSLARLTGWTYATMPYINGVILTLALVGFQWCVRLAGRQRLLLALVIGTWWGFMLYLPTTMQETTHYAIAIGAAVLIGRLLHQDEPLSPRQKFGYTLFFVAAGLLKVTWSLLLLPLWLLDVPSGQPDGGNWRPGVVRLVVPVGLIGMIFLLFSQWAAPYPFNVAQVALQKLFSDPAEGVRFLLHNTLYNIQRFTAGEPLALLARLQVVMLTFVLTLTYSLRRGRIPGWLRLTARENGFHLLNLGVVLVLQVVLYDVVDWKDFRIFSPHLLLSLLVLLQRRHQVIVATVIASQVVMIGALFAALPVFNGNGGIFSTETTSRYAVLPKLERFEQQTAPYLAYDPDQSNPWCNTVLTDGYYPELLTLPPGMSFSMLLVLENFRRQPRSGYILLPEDRFTLLAGYVEVQPLTVTARGTLYLNLAADCVPTR